LGDNIRKTIFLIVAVIIVLIPFTLAESIVALKSKTGKIENTI